MSSLYLAGIEQPVAVGIRPENSKMLQRACIYSLQCCSKLPRLVGLLCTQGANNGRVLEYNTRNKSVALNVLSNNHESSIGAIIPKCTNKVIIKVKSFASIEMPRKSRVSSCSPDLAKSR